MKKPQVGFSMTSFVVATATSLTLVFTTATKTVGKFLGVKEKEAVFVQRQIIPENIVGNTEPEPIKTTGAVKPIVVSSPATTNIQIEKKEEVKVEAKYFKTEEGREFPEVLKENYKKCLLIYDDRKDFIKEKDEKKNEIQDVLIGLDKEKQEAYDEYKNYYDEANSDGVWTSEEVSKNDGYKEVYDRAKADVAIKNNELESYMKDDSNGAFPDADKWVNNGCTIFKIGID